MEYDGYKYDNNGKKNGITYYKCSKRSLHFCPGTMKKMIDGSLILITPHTNHERENNNAESVRMLKDVLKRRAASENVLLKHIYEEECRNHPIAANIYPWPTAESLMRLARRSSMPRLPLNLQELATTFENGHLNRFDCCDISIFRNCVRDIDGKTSIIFACPVLIQLVLGNEIDEIHADATFKVVPANMGYQLLSIHAIIQNNSIPIIFALMESKSRHAYDSVFRFIKDNILPNFAPSIILTDYESALRDVLQSYFPTARVSGCWFHHNQAVFKNMKKKNYFRLVKENQFALKTLKLLFGLPLLPSREIERGFQLVKAYAINHGVPMHNLFTYYERYWLRNVGPHIISVHNLPRRTNNNIESFHNQLRLKFAVTHPNLWVFLNHLNNIFKTQHIVTQQLLNNLRPTRNLKSKYLLLSKRIRHATNHHEAGLISTWQFMQIISHSSSEYLNRQINFINEIGNQESEPEIDIFETENDNVHTEDRNSTQQNQSTCMVCMINTVDNCQPHIIIPCGHAWICEVCISSLSNQICPLCRLENVTYQRIFFNF